MDKPQIYALVEPPPELGGSTGKVVLKGMVFDLSTVHMDVDQAKAIAAELNDRLEAGDLDKLVKSGELDPVRDQVFRRAVRYTRGKAESRRVGGMPPLATLAALMAGVGDMAVTASELVRVNRKDDLDDEAFESACRGATSIILETIILLGLWGIDARMVIRTFLDVMEGRKDDAEELTDAKVSYLRVVKPEEGD